VANISKEERERRAAEKAAKEAAEQEAAEESNEEQETPETEEAVDPVEKTDPPVASAVAVAKPKATPKKSGDVQVYCKLPHGIKFQTPAGEITLAGSSSSNLVGGFGVTAVPKAAWEYVEGIYGKTKMFESGVIFSSEKASYGNDKAEETGKTVKSGMERKDQKEIFAMMEKAGK
jgi:hypothetical protein